MSRALGVCLGRDAIEGAQRAPARGGEHRHDRDDVGSSVHVVPRCCRIGIAARREGEAERCRSAPIAPNDSEDRLSLRVAVAFHVGEVEAHPVFREPREARPEISPSAPLECDLVRQVEGAVLGRVLEGGVDLEDVDGLGLQLGGDLAHLGPEFREGPARKRCRSVDYDGDGVDALGADRGKVEARVDEAAVGHGPAVVAACGVGHVAPQQRAPVEGARVGVADRLLDGARCLALRLGQIEGLVHGLVPHLLLVVDVDGRVFVLRIVVLAVSRRVFALRIVALGGIVAVGRVFAVAVFAVAGLQGGRVAAVACGGRGSAVTLPLVVLGIRQAVVGLLDADPVPGFRVGRELEARVAQQTVGDELGGALPALGIALAPPRVVLERAGQHHAPDRGLDEIGVGVGDPAIAYKLINARSETVSEKPSFRSAYRRRRCLIPADGFYEWTRRGKTKQPSLIGPKDGGVFAFAGLWERWMVPEGAALTGSLVELRPGDVVETCTILTTAANGVVARVHNRMPVILLPGAFDPWLEGEEVPLGPCPADAMTIHPVSTLVNKPANDDPRCVEAVAVG